MTANDSRLPIDLAADRLLAAYSKKARSAEYREETLERIASALTNASMGTWSDALQAARDAAYRADVRADRAATLLALRRA